MTRSLPVATRIGMPPNKQRGESALMRGGRHWHPTPTACTAAGRQATHRALLHRWVAPGSCKGVPHCTGHPGLNSIYSGLLPLVEC